MAVGEDRKIIIRGVTRRAVETFLLVLGLSLGIGAAAAGIALVARTIRASEELLASPAYREIIVSTRSEAEEMESALVAIDGGNDVVLTSLDLAAADEAPDVAYAYIKQPRVFRNMVSIISRMQRSTAESARSAETRGGGEDQDVGGEGSGGPGGETADSGGEAAAGSASAENRPAFRELTQDLDSPEPTVDEWYGYAVTPEFFQAWGLSVAAGDLFTSEDIASGSDNVMIVGSELGRTLFADGQALGRKVVNFRQLATIAGVLEPTGTEMDRLAFVPAFMPDVSGNIRTNEVAQFRAFWNSDLSFMVADSTRLDEAAAQIRSYFEREYGAEAVTLSVPREEAEATRDRNARLTAIILFLGVSGLFIAGVNVSNILLSRAMRRQRTVGILKALGASRNAIFRLFFTEALAIGVAATIVGLFVSILLARLMQSTIDIGRINPAMLAVGLGVSWVVSTVLTVFPAMQASRIPAAEAMRTE
jgi:hypothetical protein